MAVVATPPPGAPPALRRGSRGVTIWLFVRLKLRLTTNTLNSQPLRAVGFALGLVIGLMFAVFALVGLAATALAPVETAYAVAVLVGSAVVLGWTLVPLLFFGVDETLDPARFALLPIPRPVLVRGTLAAAFVGVPAVVTALGTLGLGIAAWLRFGPVAGLAALVGVGAGLVLGVVASRALTSALAALLRSRRVRDLAAVLLALLASSIGPIQWAIAAAAESGSLRQVGRAAEVLAWTPLGAAYALPYDVAAGRWIQAGARAGIVVAAIGLLLWWWSRSLESAMLASGSGGAARRRATAAGGAVGHLLPAWLRRFATPGPFAAIMAKELRFWWRDGRRRPALVSILVASAVLPIALSFAGRDAGPGLDATGGVFVAGGFSFAATMSGTLTGLLLCNQFGFDGTAFASHLLWRVPGVHELRARAAAIAMIIVPAQIVIVVTVCAVTGVLPYLPVGLGVLAASSGTGLATAALLSVLVPYALPANQNPFATNTGTGTVKGLFAFVALLATLVLSLPVTIAALLIPSPVWGWALLPVGVAYGVGAARLGTSVAGDILDRRGPEILAAVTPRR